jgi:hypothetical protein
MKPTPSNPQPADQFERTPESLCHVPKTIPAGWDLSEMLPAQPKMEAGSMGNLTAKDALDLK